MPRLERRKGFLVSRGGSLVADSMLGGVPVASSLHLRSLFHMVSLFSDAEERVDRLLCDVIHSLCSL